MLTPDMKRIIEQQRLGFVATAAPDGTPNLSPKGTFVVLDDVTIAFGEIRSPGTTRNLRENALIEVNFVVLSCARATGLPGQHGSSNAGKSASICFLLTSEERLPGLSEPSWRSP
jgi:predicted pyridoxine 5'-phosphate oxidase superfamily flavin-nucleotide-binding protein